MLQIDDAVLQVGGWAGTVLGLAEAVGGWPSVGGWAEPLLLVEGPSDEIKGSYTKEEGMQLNGNHVDGEILSVTKNKYAFTAVS